MANDTLSESPYRRSSYAKQYDDDRFGKTFGSWLESSEVKLYMQMTENCHGAILDVGAGTGKLTVPLLAAGRRVISADTSAEMLHVARAKAMQAGAALQAVVCDASRLCFADRSFECVVCSRALMHFADWRLALQELCRVSRTSVILDFPPRLSAGGLGAAARRMQRWWGRSSQTYRTFFLYEVLGELKRNAFEVVEIDRQFVLPVLVHRWFDRPTRTLRWERWCRMLGLRRLFGAPVTVNARRQDSHRAPCP